MTLIELLSLYGFRDVNPDLEHEDNDYYDSRIVRIYYNDSSRHNWFEIGVNDWNGGECKVDRLKLVIKEEILNRQVYVFYYNDNINALCIELMPVFCPAEEE